MKLKVNQMVNLLFRKFVFLTVVNLFLFILQLSGAHKVKIKPSSISMLNTYK
jgi:hypothetical protein